MSPDNRPMPLLNTLPLKYIGHISVVGDCFCFGLAVEYTPQTYRSYPIYLNIAGAATSVEAVWARLVQGKELTVTPLERNTSSIVLHSPEKGLYTRMQRKIEWLGMDNLILLHRQLAQPEFIDQSFAYVIALDSAQASLRLVDYISKLVKIAVFPQWGEYLRKRGYRENLLTPHTSFEGVEFWTIHLDAVGWTSLICNGLRRNDIQLP